MKNFLNGTKPSTYYSSDREDMLGYILPGKILEVGCGEGFFGFKIKQLFEAEVWGIEYDNKSAQNASKILDKVYNGDINNLIPELPDNYFDCIVFNDVLEHLADPFLVLEQLKNKLSDKGHIIASIPNVRYWENMKSFILQKDWKYEDSGILDKTHLRFFTYKSIIRMFESLDYEIIKIEGINKVDKPALKILNLFTFNYFYDCKFVQFACVARKK